MFLNKIKSLSKTTSFRLALGHSLLFFLSSLIFFSTVYIFFFASLKDTDQTLIKSKLKQYSNLIAEQGVEGLEKFFANETSDHSEARFTVRIQDQRGQTIFFHLADDLNEFDIHEIEPNFIKFSAQPGWSYIRARNDLDQIEIRTEKINPGLLIQVGRSTSERQDFLERATAIFAIATLFSLLIGAVGGYWFSKRTLSPLRDLLQTTQKISKENLQERVKDTGSNDEFSELVSVFNSMLNRIQNLVGGMQQSLDGIAHDLKTPMTRMKAAADLTLGKPNPSAEECLSALAECSENSGEILSLLNSLLDIFEADAGAMKLRREEFELSSLVQEVFDLYEIIADEKEVKLQSFAPQSLPIIADRSRMKQVLANLVDNALKYSPPQTTVRVNAEATSNGWMISIQDQGPGIRLEDLSRIWDRLYRGETNRSQAGSGLGLSLVKAIVSAHGGRVSVETVWGQGSTFRLQLPVSP